MIYIIKNCQVLTIFLTIIKHHGFSSLTTTERKCPACNSDVSEQARFCYRCGTRLVSNRLNDIIEIYVDEKITEKFTSENNIIRSLSDDIEDVVYRRLKIVFFPISTVVSIIILLIGFFGYKTYKPINIYLKQANVAALNAKKTAEKAQSAAEQQARDVASLHANIVSLKKQTDIIRNESSDQNLRASLPSLGMKKGVYFNGAPFKNPEGKRVAIIYITQDAQLNYSFEQIKEIKNSIESKGFLVLFGYLSQSKFGTVGFLNNFVSNIGGSSTLYFKKEDSDLASFIQNKFSSGTKFEKAPVFIDSKKEESFSSVQKYIIENSNVDISVEVY